MIDRIGGLVLGPVATIETTEGGPELAEVVLDVLGDRDVPVLGNTNIGHEPPNLPLPVGVRAELDATARSLTLLEAAVR